MRRSTGIGIAVAILLIGAAAVGGTRVMRSMRADLALRAIPAIPDLAAHNAAAIERIRGAEADARRDPEKAIPLCEKAVRIDFGDPDAWVRLGLLLLAVQRMPVAREALGKAAAIDPLHPLAGLGRARLAASVRDRQGVVGILEPVVAAHPPVSPVLPLRMGDIHSPVMENGLAGLLVTMVLVARSEPCAILLGILFVLRYAFLAS